MEHKQFTELASGANTTLTFNWNTTDVTPCFNYAIWAEASVLPDEVATADNTFIGGKVKVKMLGDVNSDRVFDIYDLALCGKNYEKKSFKFVLSQLEHNTTKYLNNSKDYNDRVERWE